VNVSGIPGKQYDLMLWNSGQIVTVEGAKLIEGQNGEKRIRIELPASDSPSYVHGKILIHFAEEATESRRDAR
jgi:hypothetical protein